jgi:hypothetical protein
MSRDELAGGALHEDPALVHDHEPVAELRRLFHVVRRDQQRNAVPLEGTQLLPHEVARLRVEPRRRLVEDQDLRLVDERARDQQAAFHAARQLRDRPVALVLELDELQQLFGPRPRDATRDAEISGVDEEVLDDRDLLVEVVLLRDDPHASLDLARAAGRWHAEHLERPIGGRDRAGDHSHGGRLPRAVRAQEAEAPLRFGFEVDAADGLELPEALGEAARDDGGHG